MTRRTKEIAKGKTANIISKDQLAITIGSTEGVEVGDTVVIRNTVEIKDPDTHESLGVFHQTRLRLRVSIVATQFAIASVTEAAPASPTVGIAAALDSTRVRRTKTIARSESTESESAVWVLPGEPVVVTRVVEDDN